MSKIEKEFNQKAKQISIQPSGSAWPNLHAKMNSKKKKKLRFIHLKFYSIIVMIILVLLICLVAFLLVKSQLK